MGLLKRGGLSNLDTSLERLTNRIRSYLKGVVNAGEVATRSQVASGTGAVLLLAANKNRVSVIIENTDTNKLYVSFGTVTATTSNYTFQLAQHANKEVLTFRGPIYGIWAGDGSGSALMTEVESTNNYLA